MKFYEQYATIGESMDELMTRSSVDPINNQFAEIVSQFSPAETALSQRDITSVYSDAQRIRFAPNVYTSTADYTAEVSASVVSLGEVATRVVASARPVEGTYHNATAADMRTAVEAYTNGGVHPQVAAAAEAARQRDMVLFNDLVRGSNDDDETSSNRLLVKV